MAGLREGLGKRLQQLRKAAGLTQEKLASQAEVDPKYLGSVERGEKSVSLEVLERIIRALDVEAYMPFLFTLKGHKMGERVEEQAILELLRKTDRSVRPLLVTVTDAILRWAHSRKP